MSKSTKRQDQASEEKRLKAELKKTKTKEQQRDLVDLDEDEYLKGISSRDLVKLYE